MLNLDKSLRIDAWYNHFFLPNIFSLLSFSIALCVSAAMANVISISSFLPYQSLFLYLHFLIMINSYFFLKLIARSEGFEFRLFILPLRMRIKEKEKEIYLKPNSSLYSRRKDAKRKKQRKSGEAVSIFISPKLR